MNSLAAYEAWLFGHDHELYVEGRAVVSKIGNGFQMSLEACPDAEALVRWTRVFNESISSDPNLPVEHLTKRFSRLVVESNGFRENVDEIVWEALLGYRRSC